AYIGASYANGEDPIANIKNLIGMDGGGSSDSADRDRADDSDTVADLEDELRRLERENRKLKDELNDREDEIEALKKRLE
ncbi:MAG: hypothetical protein AAFO94_10705, partial [Bacteroidota bacterium]